MGGGELRPVGPRIRGNEAVEGLGFRLLISSGSKRTWSPSIACCRSVTTQPLPTYTHMQFLNSTPFPQSTQSLIALLIPYHFLDY